MSKIILTFFFLIVATASVKAAPCSANDEPSLCLWEFIKLLGIRDRLPINVKSALIDAFANGIMFGRCGNDVPSEELIKTLEQAVSEKVIPSCVVDVLKSIRPCEDLTTEQSTISVSVSNTVSLTSAPTTSSSQAPTVTEAPTTVSSPAPTTTEAPRRLTCDPPQCDLIRDSRLRWPSLSPSNYYSCALNSDNQQWSSVEYPCEQGNWFNYLSQRCEAVRPAEDVCSYDELPPVTPYEEPTTATTVTEVPTTEEEPVEITDACDPPQCDIIQDSRLRWPSYEPSIYYSCVLNSDNQQWSSVEYACEQGTWFNYLSQRCEAARPSEDVCTYDELPPVTPYEEPTTTTTVTVTDVPITSPSTEEPVTTTSSSASTTTEAPRRLTCDPPQCDIIRDSRLRWPSSNPSNYYSCALNSDNQQWSSVEYPCEQGNWFNYLSQRCETSRPVEDVCGYDELPSVTPYEEPTTTTTVTVTDVPITSPSTEEPVTTTSNPAPTTTEAPRRLTCDPPQCETIRDSRLRWPSSSPSNYYSCVLNSDNQQWSSVEYSCEQGNWFNYLSQRCEAAPPSEDVCSYDELPSVTPYEEPTTTTTVTEVPTTVTDTPTTTTTTQSPPTTTVPGTTTTVPYWELPDFGGSMGKTRQWVIPNQYGRIFDTIETRTPESFAALFQAISELNNRLAMGQSVENWMPGYLLNFNEDVQMAFRSMRDEAIAGQTAGDYDYTYPAAVQTLVSQFNANGKQVPWEVIEAWKDAYSQAYSNIDSAADLQTYLQQSIGQLVGRGAIPQADVAQWSSLDIAETLFNGAKADQSATGNMYSGPDEDIINPLITRLLANGGTDFAPIQRLLNTRSELNQELNSGRDITNFVPATFSSDLESYGLDANEIGVYMDAYTKIRSRFIRKSGNQREIQEPSEGGEGSESQWYSPDARLQPVYQKLIDNGKMTQDVFNTLQKWQDAISQQFRDTQSLDVFETFVPASFESDIANLPAANEADYRNAYTELRALIKTFVTPA